MPPEYLPNKEVERLAIQAVRRHEKKAGRAHKVREVRRAREGSGYDLISGDRRIEVKGTQGGRITQGLVLNSSAEVKNLKRGGWLYRVTRVGSAEVRVHELKGSVLHFPPEKRWRVTRKKK